MTLKRGVSVIAFACFGYIYILEDMINTAIKSRLRTRQASRPLSYLAAAHARILARKIKETSLVQKDTFTQSDLEHAIQTVRGHDPAAYLPGILLNSQMSAAYYAVRSFWVETGLRFGTTALVPPNSTPLEHLDWWKSGVEAVFDDFKVNSRLRDHPTLRMLHTIKNQEQNRWDKDRFVDLIRGRRSNLEITQYETLEDLKRHAKDSCGNLIELVLESGGIDATSDPKAHDAARHIGICHGLANALRMSIGIVSLTGRLVIPRDLIEKYNVKRPRYLLSALSMGDKEMEGLQQAVGDIVAEARKNLAAARLLREDVLLEPRGKDAVVALIPGVASETFLDRLEQHRFSLTERSLRQVGLVEHLSCSFRTISAYATKRY